MKRRGRKLIMKQRVFSVMLALALLLLALMPAALAEDEEIPASAGYYYVYTADGKTLNVRDTPGGEVVGHLKYGTRIFCYYNDGGWALIDYEYDKPGYGKGIYACFVSSRYLRTTKPEALSTSSSSGSKTSSSGKDTLSDLNREFASATRVTPFSVTVRPSRASGWANMRWAPSKDSELMATYAANTKLLVIRETTNWYQVEDQETGDVGFIRKDFVIR